MRPQFIALLLCSLFLFSSCYSLKVTTQSAVPVSTVTGEEERVKTIHLLPGTKKTWQEDLCDGAALAEVTIESNLLQSLVNVLTLGIWMPITVRYKCNEPN